MINGLPEKLRELRTKNGLSQKHVSEILGISPSVVSAYETGERTPSTEVLLSISYLYHCSTDYLLGKENEKPSMYINIDGLTNVQIKALQTLINSMKS